MLTLLNLLVSLVVAPAVLAGVAYYTTRDESLAILSAVLSAFSGLVCVWDVVRRPGPKLGADWRVPTPKNYVLLNGVAYLIAIPLTTWVLTWVQRTFGGVGPRPLHLVWLVILIGACLWVPRSKAGPDAGVPLEAD